MASKVPGSRPRGLSIAPISPTHPPKRTRTRSNTLESSLYDEDYKHYIHETCQMLGPKVQPWDLSAPENVTSPDDMTETRIRHAYFYAHWRLKARKVTPRTHIFLQEYRTAAQTAMNQPTRDNQVQLFALNRILNSKVILYKEPSLLEIEGQKAMKKLIQLRYLADYGDYLAEQCKRFRDYSMEKNTDGLAYFTGGGQNWNVIQANMEVEEASYKTWVDMGKPDASPVMPTVNAVRRACTELGFDHENTRWAIKWYSNRNDSMHCSVGVYIRNCDWPQLAEKLWKDIRELPHVFGNEEYRNMKKVLETIKDRYFDNLDDPLEPVFSVKSTELTVAQHNKLRVKMLKAKKSKGGSAGSAEKAATSAAVVLTAEQQAQRKAGKSKTDSSSDMWGDDDVPAIDFEGLAGAADHQETPDVISKAV